MDKEQIFQLVVQSSREILPELEDHNFVSTDALDDLGANSMDRSEIIMMVMEELDLNIPRVDVFGADNIAELVDILHDKLQAA